MTHYLDKLKIYSSYDAFRPGQAESLDHLDQGVNTLSILPTGGGKSLIYQLFQFQRPGHTIIVSPLISLMQDQVEQLQQAGIKSVVALNSNLDRESQNLVRQQLNRYQFIFLSPEMIQRPDILHQLKQLEINLLVVDEAHCISQWGYDFRPEYSELLFVRQQLQLPLTLALTATATEKTMADIKALLFTKNEQLAVVQTSIDRPNIFYAFKAISSEDKLSYLKYLLETMPKPGIVYVHQKQELEEIVQALSGVLPIKIASYHADRSVDDRHIIQQQFLLGDLDVIFATSAFGMGINQANVRFVIHYHLPQSLEELSQEIGRAGRDGLAATAVVLYNKKEIYRLKAVEERYLADNSLLIHHLKQYAKLDMQGQITYLQSLNETEQAYIRFYSKHFKDLATVETHYEALLQAKQQQIQDVINLVLQKTCYRQTLLAAFNQEGPDQGAYCCSNCQTDFEQLPAYDDFLALEAAHSSSQGHKINWQNRLNILLKKMD